MMISTKPRALDAAGGLASGQSARPALTRLALLAAANPTVAACLLLNPSDAANAHPHYVVSLDADDRATLTAIQSRVTTVDEFLWDLANIVDGTPFQ